jgi:hypothetical protein
MPGKAAPNRNTHMVQEMPVFIDRNNKDLARVIDALNQAHSKIADIQTRISKLEQKING